MGLKITLKKSPIGYAQDQKDTVTALGLKKIGQTVEHPDNKEIRGMVNKVRHLLDIEEALDHSEQGE